MDENKTSAIKVEPSPDAMQVERDKLASISAKFHNKLENICNTLGVEPAHGQSYYHLVLIDNGVMYSAMDILDKVIDYFDKEISNE